MEITVVGTGKMGAAFVRRAAAAGFTTYCWNRTRERLRDLPCIPLDRLEDTRGLVVVFVFDDDALYQTALKAGGEYVALAGTYSVRAVDYVVRRLEKRGAAGFAMPVLGSPRNVESGDAIYIVGANDETYSKIRHVLEKFGTLIHVGDSKKAAALKLAYNLLLISTVAALGESVALAKKYGVEVDVFKQLLSNTVFREIAARYVDRMLAAGTPTFTVEGAAKDLRYAANAASEAGMANVVASGVKTLYELLVAAGRGNEDYVKAGVLEGGL